MTTARRVEKPLTWREIAAAQSQVLGRDQALASGMTPDAWDWRLRHRWQSAVPGVAVLHTGVIQPAEWRWVAVVHCGKGARLTGDGVLLERGMKRLDVSVLHVAVDPRCHIGEVEGDGVTIVPMRRVLKPVWLAVWPAGPPMLRTSIATLHAAACAPSDRAAELRIVMAVQQRLVDGPQLRTSLDQIAKLPRRALLRSVLDDVELGAQALSELDFLRFCRAHGLPEPDAMQVLVRADGKRYLDARYEKQRVSVELDGAGHLWAENWEADLLRTLELAVATGPDDQLVRLTGGMLRHDGDRVADLLRRLLCP